MPWPLVKMPPFDCPHVRSTTCSKVVNDLLSDNLNFYFLFSGFVQQPKTKGHVLSFDRSRQEAKFYGSWLSQGHVEHRTDSAAFEWSTSSEPKGSILFMAVKEGSNVLFCVPKRAKCILLVSVMAHGCTTGTGIDACRHIEIDRKRGARLSVCLLAAFQPNSTNTVGGQRVCLSVCLSVCLHSGRAARHDDQEAHEASRCTRHGIPSAPTPPLVWLQCLPMSVRLSVHVSHNWKPTGRSCPI
jgi:hypothetical protein